MDRTTTLVGYPEELPRRRRVANKRTDFIADARLNASAQFATDWATVERVYRWMLANGWGGSRYESQ